MNNLTATTSFPEARVLVVDDEAEVRSVLMRFLDLLGYCVEEASSGYQALEMLERTPCDVMVLDICMPSMDGVEVMRRVRQVHPGLPIILLTGHATLESAIAAVRSHAADYLLKPASMHDVATAVTGALEQHAQGERPRVLSPERFLCAGSVTLDRRRRLVIVTKADSGGSLNAKLTPSEAALLAYLMQHPGIAVSCHELARAALGYDNVSHEEAEKIIRPHICRLRGKIEPDPRRPHSILTAPDKRYLFAS